VNATQLARAAYQSGTQPIKTPRGTEYEAFARITSRLRNASGKTPAQFRDLASALHDNRRLWTILAADAAGKENKLPADLRARVVYLAEFTRLHTGKVLRDGASTAPLVEINSAIMRGLGDRRTLP
jgi:flagellar protein FlaF